MSTPTRPRRLRTWSAFGDLGRVPSDYEIVTHGLNYTYRPGRAAALESNPTAPMNMWFLTYRDKSPLQADTWDGFRDPEELTYRKYVTLQDEAETVAEKVLDEFEAVGHDSKLTPEWLRVLASVFTPMRYPTHGLQMCQAYLGLMAPSSYTQTASVFATADLLRRVTLVAYRAKQLEKAHPAAGFVTGERRIWETEADWQPARRAVEQALVAYDWGECLTAVNLVLRPTLEEVLLRQLALVADANGDQLTWLLLSNLAADSDRAARWSATLARYAVAARPENAEVLGRWVDRWSPRADEAAAGLARLLAKLPAAGRDETLTTQAASAARGRVLADAGLAGSPVR
jgi:toluene monooxygenase system protein E